MAPVRTAVVGCGDISAVHFDAIARLPDVQLVAVADEYPGRLAAASEAQRVPGYTDLAAMLDAERPDVVHVCTPHSEHAWMTLACLARGIAVVTEKPLAHTLAEGEALAEAAAASGTRVAVCFQNRYNPTVVALKAALDSGTLGRVLAAHATVVWHRTADYYLDRPWRGTWAGSGGGLLMNQAIHTVDLVQWLLGDVESVVGSAANRSLAGVIEVEDTADMVLEHAGGVRSVLYATLANAANAPVVIDIVTERATLHLRGALTITHADGRVDVVDEQLARPGERAYWGVSHELLIRDFYARLDEPGPFWIHPGEALKSLRIVKDLYSQSFADAV
jgi:UDP-N-acetyl-2-amino-2-deoxyglucuronate dehydrogenase